jgi:hypothetical protein
MITGGDIFVLCLIFLLIYLLFNKSKSEKYEYKSHPIDVTWTNGDGTVAMVTKWIVVVVTPNGTEYTAETTSLEDRTDGSTVNLTVNDVVLKPGNNKITIKLLFDDLYGRKNIQFYKYEVEKIIYDDYENVVKIDNFEGESDVCYKFENWSNTGVCVRDENDEKKGKIKQIQSFIGNCENTQLEEREVECCSYEYVKTDECITAYVDDEEIYDDMYYYWRVIGVTTQINYGWSPLINYGPGHAQSPPISADDIVKHGNVVVRRGNFQSSSEGMDSYSLIKMKVDDKVRCKEKAQYTNEENCPQDFSLPEGQSCYLSEWEDTNTCSPNGKLIQTRKDTGACSDKTKERESDIGCCYHTEWEGECTGGSAISNYNTTITQTREAIGSCTGEDVYTKRTASCTSKLSSSGRCGPSSVFYGGVGRCKDGECCSDSGYCGTGYGYCDTTWNRNRKYDGLDKVKYAYE